MERFTLTTVLALMTLFASAGSAANTCVPAASGNWSAASTWKNCGGTIPQPGDTVSISTGDASGNGYRVTLDTNTSVASILINSACCSTQHTGLVNDGQAHTVTMTIAGAHCLTTRNRADFDISNTSAGNEVTFSCPNLDSSHAVIANTYATPYLGNETVRCYHCVIGAGAGDGFYMTNAFGGLVFDVRNSRQCGGKRFLVTANAVPNFILIGNTFDGLSGQYAVEAQSAAQMTGWIFTDNTDINSRTEGRMLRMQGAIGGGQFLRNAVLGLGVARGLAVFNRSANTVGPVTASYNIGATTTVGAYGADTVFFSGCTGTSAYHCGYDHNVAELFFNGVRYEAYNDSSYNVITGNANTSAGQGCFIATTGSHITSTKDTCLLDSNNGILGWLVISSSGDEDFAMDGALIYMGKSDTGNSYSVGIGEGAAGSGLQYLMASISNTISLNVTNGLGANNPDDTFVTTGPGGTGVFHNISIGGAGKNYDQNGVASFGSGHPNTSTGDSTAKPGVISVTRRLKDCDAIAFGGPGTQAHLFSQLALRWNGTNGNVTPENIWNCMAAPLAAQNPAIAQAGYQGTHIGPYKPKLISAPSIP